MSDDILTIALTIEEDNYSPITVEGAALSLFVDRCEVCVPQTRFTVTVYFRDVHKVIPWSPERPTVVLLTGVFARRRYVLSAPWPNGGTTLQMIGDIIKSRVQEREEPKYPSSRINSPYHQLQATVFDRGVPIPRSQSIPTNIPDLSNVSDTMIRSRRAPPPDVNASAVTPRRSGRITPDKDPVGLVLSPPQQLWSETVSREVQTEGEKKLEPELQRNELVAPWSDANLSTSGPVESPPPPLWLLQRNMAKIELHEKQLHQRQNTLPPAAALAPPSGSDSVGYGQPQAEFVLKFPAAESELLRLTRSATETLNFIPLATDISAQRVEDAEKSISAKASALSMTKQRSQPASRDDIVAAIAGESPRVILGAAPAAPGSSDELRPSLSFIPQATSFYVRSGETSPRGSVTRSPSRCAPPPPQVRPAASAVFSSVRASPVRVAPPPPPLARPLSALPSVRFSVS